MADSKISELTAIDALASGDLLAVVDDPAGTPASKKATVAQVQDFIEAQANTFTATQTMHPGTDTVALVATRFSVGQTSNIIEARTGDGVVLASVDKAGNVAGGTYNKVTVTAPATGSTLTIADGKTLTASNTLTLSGTDGSTLNIGTGGTLGALATVTPGTGVATAAANAVNGSGGFVTSATYEAASGKKLTANNSLTLAGTDGTTMTFPSTSGTVATLGNTNTFTAKQTLDLSGEQLVLGGTNTGVMSFAGSSSGKVTIQAANAAGTYTLTLPTTDGDSGQALLTDGSGVLSWGAVGGTPGGSDTQVQFNDGGAFGGDSALTWNKTTNTMALAGQAALTLQTLTDGANIAWNCANGAKAKVTLGGNRTMDAVTNAVEGTSYTLWVIQDNGGSRTITWTTSGAGSFDFGTDGAPTLTTTGDRADLLGFEAVSIGGTLKLRFAGIKKGFA